MIEELTDILLELLDGVKYGEVGLTLKIQDGCIVFIEKSRIDREKPQQPRRIGEVPR